MIWSWPARGGVPSTAQSPELTLAGWLRDGRLISRAQIIDGGVRAFPAAVLKLFAGENIGKLIIAVAPTTS